MRKTVVTSLTLLMGVLLLGVGSAQAQTNAEVNAGIQLNFSTPGARSLGLGGAFIGLADDATAAYANPAGLTTLSRPEISLEGRQWDYTSVFTDSGHAFGEPTGNGLNTVAGIRQGEAESDTTGLSFFSFVYPAGPWAVAFYRHELANFETSFATQGAFFSDGFRFFPTQSEMELDIVNYGLSAAIRLSESFTIGAGVSYYEFEIDSLTNRYGFDFDLADPTAVGGFYGPPDYSAGNVFNYQEQVGEDNKYALNLGFMWDLSSRVSLGGVFRSGPEFKFKARSIAGSDNVQPPGTVFTDVTADFNVPDVYGLGLAFRLSDAATLAMDWVRVEYSVLTEDMVNLFTEDLDAASQRLEIDDGDEFHVGFEYVFINPKMPVAIRLGSWLDPDHRIAFQGDPGDDQNLQNQATLFRPGDDEWHYSVGIGLIFGERFQLDAAADFSEFVDTLSLSGVVRF